MATLIFAGTPFRSANAEESMNTRHDWITAPPKRTDGQLSFVGNGHRLGQNDASVRVDETLLSFRRSEGPIDLSLIESPSCQDLLLEYVYLTEIRFREILD